MLFMYCKSFISFCVHTYIVHVHVHVHVYVIVYIRIHMYMYMYMCMCKHLCTVHVRCKKFDGYRRTGFDCEYPRELRVFV